MKTLRLQRGFFSLYFPIIPVQQIQQVQHTERERETEFNDQYIQIPTRTYTSKIKSILKYNT